MKTEITRLNLISPLLYVPGHGSDPFNYKEGNKEMLFCFELNEEQYRSFEPDKTALLSNLIFGGQAACMDGKGKTEAGPEFRELPPGDYLFAQKRELLSREDIINMASEMQSEGLWQRLKPGKRLYLRYLYEDGCQVTQLFRPYFS